MKKHILHLMILIILVPLLSFINVTKLKVYAQEGTVKVDSTFMNSAPYIIILKTTNNQSGNSYYVYLKSTTNIVVSNGVREFYSVQDDTNGITASFGNMIVLNGILVPNQELGSTIELKGDWWDYGKHQGFPNYNQYGGDILNENSNEIIYSNYDVYIGSWTEELGVYATDTMLFSKNIGELTYTHNQYDYTVIPDKYNTGCKGDLTPMSEYFSDIHTPGTAFYMTSAIQNTYGTVFENIHFEDVLNLNKTGLESMVFRNCKFSCDATYNVNSGSNFESNNIEVLFENCEFTNSQANSVQPSSHFKFINCKFHDVQADGSCGQGYYENCYFYNIGMDSNSHADGIQIKDENNNVTILNCRFDVVSYTGYTSNAGIFFMLENGVDSNNCTIKDIYINGGNYSLYYGVKIPEDSVITNNTLKNIIVGCNKHYGNYSANVTIDESEIKDADKLFVSSVYKEDDKIKLLVTNYTNEEKTLVCVTDDGTKEINVPACPTYDEGLYYTSLNQFPLDVEVELDNSEYIVCYSDEQTIENQIRYINFNELELPIVPNNNIEFEANIGSWFEINIPNQHIINENESAIVLPVTGDIPGNKSLVLSVTPNVTLTNDLDSINAICTLNKDSYSFEELLQNPDVNITISVERLPVGYYAGQLSLTVGLRNNT